MRSPLARSSSRLLRCSLLGALVLVTSMASAQTAPDAAPGYDVPFSTMDALVSQMDAQATAMRTAHLSPRELEDTALRMTLEQEQLDQLAAIYTPLVTRTPELRGSVLDLAAAAQRHDRAAVRRQATLVSRNLAEFRSWLAVAAAGTPSPASSTPAAPPEALPPCP